MYNLDSRLKKLEERTRPIVTRPGAATMPPATRQELRERWVRHYENVIARLQASSKEEDRQAVPRFVATLERFKSDMTSSNPFGLFNK